MSQAHGYFFVPHPAPGQVINWTRQSSNGIKSYSMSIDIGSIIVRAPDVRGGKPHIAGTGITVHRNVRWYKQGHSPEQIADEYSHIALAQVYAALAYYHANQAEIEAELASEDADIARRERETRAVSPGV